METTKLTPFNGTDLERHEENWELACQRNVFSNPGQFDWYWSFMTPPGPECTCREPEKSKVWPNGDRSATIDMAVGR
jgi:hypothetical protein